jgi:hypothetical protein
MQTCLRRCRADLAAAGPRRVVSGVLPTASILIDMADAQPLGGNL